MCTSTFFGACQNARGYWAARSSLNLVARDAVDCSKLTVPTPQASVEGEVALDAAF